MQHSHLGKALIVHAAHCGPAKSRACGGSPASKPILGAAFGITMANHDTRTFEAAAGR